MRTHPLTITDQFGFASLGLESDLTCGYAKKEGTVHGAQCLEISSSGAVHMYFAISNAKSS